MARETITIYVNFATKKVSTNDVSPGDGFVKVATAVSPQYLFIQPKYMSERSLTRDQIKKLGSYYLKNNDYWSRYLRTSDLKEKGKFETAYDLLGGNSDKTWTRTLGRTVANSIRLEFLKYLDNPQILNDINSKIKNISQDETAVRKVVAKFIMSHLAKVFGE